MKAKQCDFTGGNCFRRNCAGTCRAMELTKLTVDFQGRDPLNPFQGAHTPMIPNSWRFSFVKHGDGYKFVPHDQGDFVAWPAVNAALDDAARYQYLLANCIERADSGDLSLEFGDFENYDNVTAAIDAARGVK